MSILSRTGTEKDFFLIRTDYNEIGHTGYDGVMMNVHEHHPYNEPSIDRRNYNEADYAFLFGERSHIYPTASGSGAFGGVINLYGENSYGFGYRIFGFQNQGFSGGSRIGNNAKESLIYGNTINVDCTWNNNTKTYTKNSTSDANLSKYLMIFGDNHNIRSGCLSDLIVGSHHTIGFGFKWGFVSGYGHNIDNYNECVNVIGYENTIDSWNSGKITDSTAIGYNNKICNKFTSNIQYAYLFGNSNQNFTGDYHDGDPSYWGDCYGNVYLLGSNLKAYKNNQCVIGDYNKGINNAIFEIGCGDSSTRVSNFAMTTSHSLIAGYMTSSDGHDITKPLEDSLVTGYLNKIHKHSVGCLISGSRNIIGPVSGTRNGEVNKCAIIGEYNCIDFDGVRSNTNWHNIMLFGRHLVATKSFDQIIVGSYNDSTPASTPNYADKFIVATGSETDGYRNSFTVGYDSTNGNRIYIGNTMLSEAKLQALLALVS